MQRLLKFHGVHDFYLWPLSMYAQIVDDSMVDMHLFLARLLGGSYDFFKPFVVKWVIVMNLCHPKDSVLILAIKVRLGNLH